MGVKWRNKNRYMYESRLPEKLVRGQLRGGIGKLTIVSVMYGIGVQDLGSALWGREEKHLRLDLKAFRAGARSILTADIV